MPPFHHFDTKQPDYIRFIVNHAFIIGNSDGKMMQRNMISMFMCKLFDEMPIRRVVSLNSLLSSYMSTRQLKEEILLSTNDAIYDSFFFPSNKLTRLFKAEGPLDDSTTIKISKALKDFEGICDWEGQNQTTNPSSKVTVFIGSQVGTTQK